MGVPAHYIIFHPEKKRGTIQVTATALREGEAVADWQGTIWVDKPPGNEDPLVLVEPWLYSYCHATQLSRAASRRPFVQPGSHLLFCSGNAAERDKLVVDTVFVVGERLEWNARNQGSLPDTYAHLYGDDQSRLWASHLQYGVPGRKGHTGRFTYEARLWTPETQAFSFLPLDRAGRRASVDFGPVETVAADIKAKVWGKRPVPLKWAQMEEILQALESVTVTKVVRDIHPVQPVAPAPGRC